MALNINGTKLKKCNVNGVKCKHINVNGVRVWSAETILAGEEVSDLSSVWKFVNDTVEHKNADSDGNSEWHISTAKAVGNSIQFYYGDHYANKSPSPYAETINFYDMDDWDNIHCNMRIVPEWDGVNSKSLKIVVTLYNESGNVVLNKTLFDNRNYSVNQIITGDVDVSSLTGNHKIRITCTFGNSYQAVYIYCDGCILE